MVPALTKKVGPDTAPTVQLSALTWILGGATVAAAGTGLVFGLIARAQENALRDGFNPDTDVYQGTRAQALEQNRNALVANVTLGVAGAALVGTVISGIVDGTRPPVDVAPVVTPDGAGVTVGGTF